jgi:GNAT superfamily N-acetyltransferase
MTPPAGIRIRYAVPSDAPTLFEYEKTYFPAVAGEYHAGYAFGNAEVATVMLTEKFSAPKRAYTIVAEDESGAIVGFAASVPQRLPGIGAIEQWNMLLNHLAVDPARRREGIASTLIAEIERRSTAAQQHVIVAHVSADSAEVYRRNGWTVLAENRGFSWIPIGDHIRADEADPGFGFPLMAVKVLRPKALRMTFEYDVVNSSPIQDATKELVRIIDAGGLDERVLDDDTKMFVQVERRQTALAAMNAPASSKGTGSAFRRR